MDLVTHSVLVISAIAVMLGLLYLRFWMAQRDRKDFLLFAIACFAAAVYSWFEMAIMNSDSPTDMANYLWWAHLPGGIAVISVAAFLYLHLDAGRKLLFWTAVGLRATGMIVNLFLSPNIMFSRITGIRYVTILGERLSIPVGTGNPWVLINHVGFACFLAFSIDATVEVWRRGDHRRAVIFGGGTLVSLIFTSALLVSIIWFAAPIPILASVAFMFIVLALGYELNADLQNAASLAKTLKIREAELKERMKQLSLSAGAADVGVWMRTLDGKLVWASDKWYELFGLEPGSDVPLAKLFEKLDPSARDRVQAAVNRLRKVGDEFEVEYRVPLNDGTAKWIRGSGRVDLSADGSLILRGAVVDITKLKLAQESAHDLSRKLMNAQEKERARLARELHDDLSQSLALLSIQLHSIATGNGDRETFSSQLGNITYQIDRLSSDVHRISHQLHPAKLEQLGLVSALRGFCREIGTAHDIKIDFHDENVPTNLANDVSLCLYRVSQESLQNVVKHSGASNVTVDLERTGDDLRLSIADNGAGFDLKEHETRDGIGLISMKERLRVVNGTVRVDSTVGSGTKVVVTVPIERSSRLIPDVASIAAELLSFST